jgi:hypothetical protein
VVDVPVHATLAPGEYYRVTNAKMLEIFHVIDLTAKFISYRVASGAWCVLP